MRKIIIMCVNAETCDCEYKSDKESIGWVRGTLHMKITTNCEAYCSDIVIAIIENLATGSAWSVMISCVSLSVLKLYAVWKPFSYRKTVTLKRSIYLIVLR